MSDKTVSPTTAKAASPAKRVELTTREVEVLAAAWVSLKADADVDIDKLAQLTGFQNPRSATNTMYAIKKKLAQVEGAGEGFTGIAPSGGKGGKTTTIKSSAANAAAAGAKKAVTPRGNNKRKGGAEDHAGTDADNEASEAPTPAPKKSRATKKSSKLAKIKDEDNEDVDAAAGDDDKAGVKEDDAEDIKGQNKDSDMDEV